MSCTFGSSVSCDSKMSVTVALMSSLELIPWIVWAVILVGLLPPLFSKVSFPVFPVILWGALYQLSVATEQITSKHSGLKPWPSHLLCVCKSVILTGLSWAVLLVSLAHWYNLSHLEPWSDWMVYDGLIHLLEAEWLLAEAPWFSPPCDSQQACLGYIMFSGL